MRILGLDFGSKVIGVAISDEAVIGHTARKEIRRGGEEPGLGTAHPLPG